MGRSDKGTRRVRKLSPPRTPPRATFAKLKDEALSLS